MRTDRELLADALKLIEYGIRGGEAHDITEEIRARLAEPEDEPVCWFDENYSGIEEAFSWIPEGDHTIPLYRRPRQPVRLSDAHIDRLITTHGGNRSLACAVERAIWEKNQ